jgi:alpha-ketoglutarate-dependent taurine dioxygenase
MLSSSPLGNRLSLAPFEMARQVVTAGWLRFSLPEQGLATQIDFFARSLGTPVAGRKRRVMEELAPTRREDADPSSLSAVHGLSCFPLHTDGAHLIEPPRFIVLACVNPGSTAVPTVLTRFQDLGVDGKGGVFLVRNGRKSFYSTICDRSRPFIRLDQGCMTPIEDHARHTLDAIAESAARIEQTVIYWRKGDVLILDNWSMLHGRGLPTSSLSSDRRLLRASVQ